MSKPTPSDDKGPIVICKNCNQRLQIIDAKKGIVEQHIVLDEQNRRTGWTCEKSG